MGTGDQGALDMRRILFAQHRSHRLPEPFLAVGSPFGRLVDQQGSIRRHAERAVFQLRGHVLGGVTEARQFRIVYGRGAIGRQMGDEAVGGQAGQHGCAAGLDDMAAEHDDHRLFQASGPHNGLGNRLQFIRF